MGQEIHEGMISGWDSQNPVHHGINYLLVHDFSHQRMKFQEKMETVRFKQPQSGRHVGCHHGHGIRCVGSDSCWLTRLGKRTSHPIPGKKRKMSAFQKSTPQKKNWQRVEASVYHWMVKMDVIWWTSFSCTMCCASLWLSDDVQAMPGQILGTRT